MGRNQHRYPQSPPPAYEEEPKSDDKIFETLISSARQPSNLILINSLFAIAKANRHEMYMAKQLEDFEKLALTYAKTLNIQYDSSKLSRDKKWIRAAQVLSVVTSILAQADPDTLPWYNQKLVYGSLACTINCLNQGSDYKGWRRSPFDGLEDMWACQKDSRDSYAKCIESLAKLWKKISSSLPEEMLDIKNRPADYSAQLRSMFKPTTAEFSYDSSGMVTACETLHKDMILINKSANEFKQITNQLAALLKEQYSSGKNLANANTTLTWKVTDIKTSENHTIFNMTLSVDLCNGNDNFKYHMLDLLLPLGFNTIINAEPISFINNLNDRNQIEKLATVIEKLWEKTPSERITILSSSPHLDKLYDTLKVTKLENKNEDAPTSAFRA